MARESGSERNGRGSRALLHVAAAWLAASLVAPPSLARQATAEAPMEAAPTRYLEAARRTARWLEACAIATEHGLRWPAVPDESDAPSPALYSGSAGVVLFFVELHRATGATEALGIARRGADELAKSLPERVEAEGAGLYTGIAGIGFALAEAWDVTADEVHRDAAVRCSELLHEAAVETEHGVKWSDTTDVISGSAGVGSWLLVSAERLDRPRDLVLAVRAGRELVARAKPEASGASWAMDPSFPRTMPNFSHGTAGVAFFLAALHDASGEAAFLSAASAGARHLLAIADRSDGGLRIHHHVPGGEGLYYMGWCHGPAGTARLFRSLHASTEAPEWRSAWLACARSIRASGIPEARTDGFWNNVGQCCGSAGVAAFFLDLHAWEGDAEHLAFARRVADLLLDRAIDDEHGLRWEQAEHRARPELLQTQTGYMQGAAGVGCLLLRLDAALCGRERTLRLPDEPR